MTHPTAPLAVVAAVALLATGCSWLPGRAGVAVTADGGGSAAASCADTHVLDGFPAVPLPSSLGTLPGQRLDRARALLAAQGRDDVRVVCTDGVVAAITDDLRPDRVDLTVDGGRVSGIRLG